MGLVQEYIKVRVNNFNEEHFTKLGYVFKRNDYINIKVSDLPSGSGIKILVQCNYCNKIFPKAYRRYLETIDNICCEDCKQLKIEESNIIKYGEKCTLRVPEILEKSKATNLEKIGVEYPLQSKEITDKCKHTMISKYGVPYSIYSPEIRKKINKSFGKSIVFTSKQQIKLHKLFGGILNYNIGKYFIDIYFNDGICFEYNGGGHNLAVIHGSITQEEFDKKDRNRILELINMGYKYFEIKSTTDKLPSDDKLIEIKNKAYHYLKQLDNDIFIYDLENESENLLKCNEL